jgi:hypothetical protein
VRHMAFIDRFKKKKRVTEQFGPKFFELFVKRYALEDGGMATFQSDRALEGHVDIFALPAERMLYITPPPDAAKEPDGGEGRIGELAKIIINGRRTGSRYGIEGRIAAYVRVKPSDERGRQLGIKHPGYFFQLQLAAKPVNLDERIDFRYVPSYMLHLLHALDQPGMARSVPRHLRSYLMPLRKKAQRGGLRYVLSEVEVRLWNPAGPGKVAPLCPAEQEAIEGPGPALELLAPHQTPLEGHRQLVADLRDSFEALKQNGRKGREEPQMEVQLFTVVQTAQKMIRGLSQTQFVNLGPVRVDGLAAEDSDALYVDGDFQLEETAGKGIASRRSTLYISANIAGRRLLSPYRYSAKRVGKKHVLVPVGNACVDMGPTVNYLDLSRSGIRIIVDRERLGDLVGSEIAPDQYDGLFAEGNRMLQPLDPGQRPRDTEELVRSLGGRLVGLNLYIDFGSRDYSIYMGEAVDDRGQRKRLYSDHFPEKVSPLVSLLAEVKNISLSAGEDNVMALGLAFSFRLLSGDPCAAPAEANSERYIWQRIGPHTSHDLVPFTEATKNYHDKRVQVAENGKGIDAVIAFQIQSEMEKARNSPTTQARMSRLRDMGLDQAPPAAQTDKKKTPGAKAAPQSSQTAGDTKVSTEGKREDASRNGVVPMAEKGLFSSLKTIVFSPEKIKVVKKNQNKKKD